MATQDPRVDAYIAQAAPFARPILLHLRALVHKACPAVTETIKWSMPFFEYQGPLCNMAAFKQHCAFGFWKTALLRQGKKMLENRAEAMGSLGRICSVEDLPADRVLLAYIKEACLLNEKQVRVPKKKAVEKKELVIPPYFLSALKKNPAATSAFKAFSYSHRKEYVEWVAEAKTEPTRQKRLEQTIAWLAEGKSRNWKYGRGQ